MPHVIVDAKVEEVRDKLLHCPRGFRLAMIDAIDRAGMRGSAYAKKVIPELYGVDSVTRQVKAVRASGRTLVGGVQAYGRMIPAVRFNYAPKIRPYFRGEYYQKGKPVAARPRFSIEVVRGKREELKGSFLQMMPSGHIGLFTRVKGEYQKNAGKLRQVAMNPITRRRTGTFKGQAVMQKPARYPKKKERMQQKFSIGTPFMMEGRRVFPELSDQMREMFIRRIDDNVQRILSGSWDITKTRKPPG